MISVLSSSLIVDFIIKLSKMRREYIMLLLKKYNNNEYISPEDKVIMYHEIPSLYKFWTEVIHKFSNYFPNQIPDYVFNQLNLFTSELKINILNNKQMGPQFDKKVVNVLLWGAVQCNRISVIDQIFQKTKYSVSDYFHHESIVNAYIKVKKYDSAIKVIDFLYKKNHKAYMFSILKYKQNENEKFNLALKEYKYKANIKLLSLGEEVNLKNVAFDDLVKIVEEVKINKKGGLLND